MNYKKIISDLPPLKDFLETPVEPEPTTEAPEEPITEPKAASPTTKPVATPNGKKDVSLKPSDFIDEEEVSTETVEIQLVDLRPSCFIEDDALDSDTPTESPEDGRTATATNKGNVTPIENRIDRIEQYEAITDIQPEHWRMLDVVDVDKWDCLPLIPLVGGIIARGNLVLLAAPTQQRKTLLSLDLAALLTRGGKLFGKFSVTGGCKVLYLALEDPDRRIKDRLLDIRSGIAGEELVPDKDRLIVHFASGLSLRDEYYFAYLENLIVEEGYDVVFLDTYQKATPGLSSFRDEEQSVILHRLSDLTRKHTVTVIVLDHLRKEMTQKKRRTITIDDIKGTGGKAQNADVIILLESMGEHQMSFRSFSKDWDTPVQILVEVSQQGSGEPKFQYVAELQESGKKSDQKRLRVLEAIKPGEWVSNGELVKRTGLGTSTVRKYLKELITEEKVLKKGEGRWTRYTLSTGSKMTHRRIEM